MSRLSILAAVGLLVAASTCFAQTSGPMKPAVPIEPIGAILEAFRSHPLVAIGDDHGNEQIHRFRLALIADPRFAARVQDIVVEFGNARYQKTLDRFMRGQAISDAELQRIWQDTTQPDYAWDLPVYEEFLRAVRAINERLPASGKLRVLLGDPPIEWSRVTTGADLAYWTAERDTYAAGVIRREVLNRGHHALIIYGGEHVAHRSGPNLAGQLETAGRTRIFTINPETHRDLRVLYPASEGWKVPSIALLAGTDLGASNELSRFDAVLYLGPLAAMSKARLSPTLCANASYMQMRLARLALISAPGSGSSLEAERLKDSCNTTAAAPAQDAAPELTEHLRSLIGQATAGNVDASLIAPESRERLIPFLKQIGVRFLQPAGPLQTLVLLADESDGGGRRRQYRASFANGQQVRWTVKTSAAGAITSMDPRPE